jgi:primosomal protein N' (replication factor Y) (superfamily II helicase)
VAGQAQRAQSQPAPGRPAQSQPAQSRPAQSRPAQSRPARGRTARSERLPAASLPVARVAVEISLPNLDRPFEYLVPEALDAVAVPGCRVRVRFAGRLTGGFLLERTEISEHEGKLGFLERVLSAEVVLTPEIAGLARAVADRYGGSLADVLRLAIPPRHAGAEAAASRAVPPGPTGRAAEPAPAEPAPAEPARAEPARAEPARAEPARAEPGPRQRYENGESFLAALAGGRSPRAVWSALPGPDWPEEIARSVAAVVASGRGAVIVVPDARDLTQIDAALTRLLAPGRHVVLSADLGPAERYRRWLAAARGEAAVVAGLRSAAFAPVSRLGLVVLWDEGDDLLAEPRAPYPHAREILVLRAHRAGAAALIGGFARTAEAQLLLSGGWARQLAARRAAVREAAPTVAATGDDPELARDEGARSARLPSLALRTVRDGLAAGPVLVQVPRQGYLAAVACERCRTPARCTCGGPAELPGPNAPLRCGWCGSPVERACARCGHGGLRALVTGAVRTAEELRRAFPGMQVVSSGGSSILSTVGGDAAIVVATPGAEPVAASGYSAAVLLDGWALLGRASLRAAEEALRRWMNAAALVRLAAAGGTVVVVADQALPAVQALIRWDPATFAIRELAARAELRFPPAARMAALTGATPAVRALLAGASLPPGAEILGPVPVPGGRHDHGHGRDSAGPGPAGSEPEADIVRYLVRVPRSAGGELAAALHAAQADRTARKETGLLRVQLDPAALV